MQTLLRVSCALALFFIGSNTIAGAQPPRRPVQPTKPARPGRTVKRHTSADCTITWNGTNWGSPNAYPAPNSIACIESDTFVLTQPNLVVAGLYSEGDFECNGCYLVVNGTATFLGDLTVVEDETTGNGGWVQLSGTEGSSVAGAMTLSESTLA